MVDTALMKEMREHEKQAAIELGQWAEPQPDSCLVGGIEINANGDLNLLTFEELRQLEALQIKCSSE